MIYVSESVKSVIKSQNYRLSVQVAYRSCRSELSLSIELSQANFYLAKLSAD